MRDNKSYPYPENVFRFIFGDNAKADKISFDEFLKAEKEVVSQDEKLCLELYFKQQKTLKDIAKIINKSPSVPSYRIFRAKNKIQGEFTKNKNIYMQAALVQLCDKAKTNQNQSNAEYFEQLKEDITTNALLDLFDIKTVDQFERLQAIQNVGEKLDLANNAISEINIDRQIVFNRYQRRP